MLGAYIIVMLDDGFSKHPQRVVVEAHVVLWVSDLQHLAVTVDVVLAAQHPLASFHHDGLVGQTHRIALHSLFLNEVEVKL